MTYDTPPALSGFEMDDAKLHLDAAHRVMKNRDEGDGSVRVGGHPGVIRAVHEFFRGEASVGTFEKKQWFFVKE